MHDSDDPTINVRRDLSEVIRLAEMLEDQAFHMANDRQFPGGDALAMLAPVANLEAWANKLDAAEQRWLNWLAGEGPKAPEPVRDDSDEWEPPLQLLCFWTELWRMDLDQELDHPTLQTEAEFLSRNITWVHDHEPRFDLFEQDVAKARRILENTLRDGERQQSGAPCVRCRRPLIRDTDPKTGGLQDSWHCPNPDCRRTYTEEQYRNAVAAGYASLQIETLHDDSTWATIERAAREVNRSARTVKTWVREGLIRRMCLVLGRRDVVSLDDVQREDDTRKRRNRLSA
jgi:hypothetical protein